MSVQVRACVAAVAALLAGPAAAAGTGSATLDAVRARNEVVCGVSGESPGFSLPDSTGVMRGLDADVCRAVAAAVLGDAKRVRFVSLSPITRFTALQSGEVDLLVRNTSWTLTREASLGLLLAFVNFHDGTAILVKSDSGVKSAKELNGATVCILPGTSTELDVAEWFRDNKLTFTPVLIDGVSAIQGAFLAGRCDAWANDASYVSAFRTTQGPDKMTVLPERLSNDPVGAMVRKGDDRWFDLVRWTGFALLTAEQSGVTSQNIDSRAADTNPTVQRLLGKQGDLGQAMGVDNAWAAHVIKQVGNYAELWDRNLAPLGIDRGPNRLSTQGGVMYAPSFR